MQKLKTYLFLLLLLLLSQSLAAQEVLKASKVQARGSLRQPSLGLPVKINGELDHAIWNEAGVWNGADAFKAAPIWSMAKVAEVGERGIPAPIMTICAQWLQEKPRQSIDIVWGPFRGGTYVALCKKTNTYLGWKSIAFVIPKEGIDNARSIYSYSKSVNWIEHNSRYNLFPRLPSHLQEIIEEMQATELLCPFQEFDPGMDEEPDREIDHDWEDDIRESMM